MRCTRRPAPFWALAPLVSLGLAAANSAQAQSVALSVSAPVTTATGTDLPGVDGYFGSLNITAQSDTFALSAGQTVPDVSFGVMTLNTGDITYYTGQTPSGDDETFDFSRPVTVMLGSAVFTVTENFTGSVQTSAEYPDPNGLPYTYYDIGTGAQTLSLGPAGSLVIGAMGKSALDESGEYATEVFPLTASVTLVAAPEQSPLAALALGILGLSGLVLHARRRHA